MASIGIVGAGVVGRATGIGFTNLGHDVAFCDISDAVCERLRAQGHQAHEPEPFRDVATDMTMISVSTPTVGRRIDLRHIRSAARDCGVRLRNMEQGHVVVVRSTLPPGTTENLVTPILAEQSGRTPGSDFFVTYNPEFLREVSAEDDFARPWLTVIGAGDEPALRALREVYDPFIPSGSLIETSVATAELIKYTSNIYNATKISFANEIGQVCRRLGIDSSVVMGAVSRSAEGMWNPAYGIRSGAPYGGACLPKDTQAFYAFGRSLGMSMELLQAVISVNERMIEQTRLEGDLAAESWTDGVPAPLPSGHGMVFQNGAAA